MQTSEAQRSFTALTQKVSRNWSQFSGVCETLHGYFEKSPTESFLVDTTAHALPQTYLQGLAEILFISECMVLELYGNGDSFRRLWPVIERWSIQLSDIMHAQDSHYLDDSTVWVVVETFYELIRILFHKDMYILQGGFHPFTDVPLDTMMDCFRRLIARIQDPTITFADRLHVHTFVDIVSRSSDEHGSMFLANRALYWMCLSLSCIPAILAEDPHKCGNERLWSCLTYSADQLGKSGLESISEALDADILTTVLKLDRVFPLASEALVGILDGIQRGLIFRGVERSARKALDKIEQQCLDADLKPGPTRDAWLATKAHAQRFHAFKNHYHTLGWDNRWLRCRNSQCPNASVGRHLKRCGVSLPLGTHDIIYIDRYVVEELKANGRHIRDLKREYMKIHPHTPVRRLVINCDYEKLPWTHEITSPEEMEERATMTKSGIFDRSDKGESQIIRLVTPWKGGSAATVFHLLYTHDYPSDEDLLIRGF
ncbi:uncharacterized protein ARMOST_02392 [Armillaria ostoyae]|uniref:Uncharacterized protein n=1 Tax=Armillaria ostoyae TaxID=47428 RepID=A0A284QRL5_ARMOS|nr:uncharacterized protein ARMOST_02392 [Armillaria ostoyae]